MRFAASIDPVLRAYLARLARDRQLSIAEINRRVGERAEVLGNRRPSYAGVRLLVGDVRMLPDEPSWAELAWSVAWREKHPYVLLDKYTGLLNKDRPEDAGL
jgi:hypothetical protein